MKKIQEEIIEKFKTAGIIVKKGNKGVLNKSYSGILSNSQKILEIKILDNK